MYGLFDKSRKDNAPVTGIKFFNSKGERQRQSIEEFGGPTGLYEMLRSTRYSGKNYVPVDPTDRSQGAQGQTSEKDLTNLFQ